MSFGTRFDLGFRVCVFVVVFVWVCGLICLYFFPESAGKAIKDHFH